MNFMYSGTDPTYTEEFYQSVATGAKKASRAVRNAAAAAGLLMLPAVQTLDIPSHAETGTHVIVSGGAIVAVPNAISEPELERFVVPSHRDGFESLLRTAMSDRACLSLAVDQPFEQSTEPDLESLIRRLTDEFSA